MSNSSNLLLWAIIGAILTGVAYTQKTQIIESFGMIPTQTIRAERVYGSSEAKNNMFMVPGTYQASLPPRQAGNVDYGAYLRYNMPDKAKRADTMGSLQTSSEMYRGPKEEYCGSCSVEGFQQPQQQPQSLATDALPVPSANVGGVNALGQETQPIVYDRFIFANQRDRLQAGADFIRGDLPIVPMAKGWFAPSASPQTALRTGSVQILSGENLQTSRELQALKSAAIGDIRPPAQASAMFSREIPSYAVQSLSTASAAGGDIQVTRFP